MFLSVAFAENLPIVLMHGFANNYKIVEPFRKWINRAMPEAYVLNCEVGGGVKDSIFMTISDQVELLSQCINNDKHMKDGFIAVGYSQGGYLFRHYIEMYNHIRAPVRRFIGISNPLGGFFCGFKEKCFIFGTFPDVVQMHEPAIAYNAVMQSNVGSSNYWRDPYHLDVYEAHARDLPLLDNLRDFDPQRKINFMSPDLWVLFGSPKDGVITPWKSAFFGQNGDSETEQVDFWDREDFEEDLFGLKSMHQQHRIKTIETELHHLEYIMPRG